MEEIVITIVEKVVECVAGPISRRARYLFYFKQFVRDVEEAKQGLQTRLEEVKERKEQVARKSEEITLPVKNWLTQVETILGDVQDLQRKVEGEGKSCFYVSLRYSLAKQMENQAKQMVELKNKPDFEPFSHFTQLRGITYFSSKDFMDFSSRKSTYNHLLEAIKDGKSKMIGLYGIGGSGKTTLAKEVGKEVDELKIFYKVIMAVVSKPPNVAKLQLEIAEQIDLKFIEETQLARAKRLSEELKNKKTLIILDDVWENLRLEDIGIPPVEGCHILLTTRLRNVCASMDCEPVIELPLINTEEAGKLFKKHANLCSEPSSNMFDDVGIKIVDECKGLPIAIVVVGRSLKGKSIVAWELALSRLKSFQPVNVEPGLISPYACLELSYDSLPNPIAKSLFLLCSMFPEDHEIHTEDLIRFGKRTLGLDEALAMKSTRTEILGALEILKDSCLLMSTDQQACVKMHDLVRDVALWITKKQGQAFLVDSDADPNLLVSSHQSFKDTKALSLWNLGHNFKLSNELRCPTLEILLLQPHGFIEDLGAIEALKVLALITNSFEWGDFWTSNSCSISRSIVSLTNLHTLCLRGKELGDISFLVELKGLEILDLRGSVFDGLPAGIADMKMLKLLDVFGCGTVNNPLEVIGRCEQLEELYFWDQNSSVSLENFSLSGLKRYVIYDYRDDFSSGIPFVECFDACIEELRALCIQGLKVFASQSSMKDLILRANFLYLEKCGFQDSFIRCSLPMLQELYIRRCPELTTIFNHATVTSLTKLKKLNIGECNKVKWLFSYSHCPSLEELQIWNCDELDRLIDEEPAHENETETAFIVVTTQSPDHLRDHKLLTIFQSLKKVFISSSVRRKKSLFEVVQVRGTTEVQEEPLKLNSEMHYLELYYLKELEYIWKGPTQSLILRRLESVELSHCPKLKNVFTLAVVISIPELKTLKVIGCEEWEGIFCEESLQNLSSSSIVCFPRLEAIGISGCHKVRRMFSYSLASHCPSLENISIEECSQLERLVDEEAAHEDRLPLLKLKELRLGHLPKLKLKEIFGGELECPQHKNENKVVNSELWLLRLEELPELEYILKGPTQSVSLYRLEFVELWDCPKLRNIFTLAVVTSLPELRSLHVNGCEEWEGIFCEESLQNLSSSSIVCFPRLKSIVISKCDKVRRLFSYSLESHCPSLEHISIEDCSQLERLIDEEAAHEDRLRFLKLKTLWLKHLPKWKEIFGGELECPQHKNENKVVKSELCSLILYGLPELEYIWKGPTQSVSLHRLETVSLGSCPKLRIIFTLAVVTNLPELRRLQVYDCEEWEGIFCEESLQNISSSSSSSSIVCFPRLEAIGISRCHKVRRLFSYSLASHCPSLENISIEDCSQLERLVDEEAAHEDRLPLLKLKELRLGHLPKLKWKEIFGGELECPQHKNEKKVVKSELCSLILYGLPELEYIWKGPTQSVSLHRLETVSLGSCPKLRNIFNLAVVTNLPELRRLQVYDCEEWEGIFCEESLQNISSSSSSIVCFPRLEAIGISGCHKVRRLFSYPLASHCPSLENISIEDCSQLERLVDEEAAHEDRLPLLKLKELRLGHLPKLKWKEIFGGELECPQHKNESKVVKLELCSLILYGLPELEYIWKGPTQSVSLHRLETVSLGSCPKLRNIFNLAVVTNLPELRRLQVYDCEEWEGIFCEESLQNISSSSSSIVCFPRLEAIGISGCHKVRRLFSYPLASHCPSLENISIEDCSQLERLVDEEAAHEDRLPLLKLKELRLGHLPKLKWKEIFGGELECPQHKNESKVVKSELCSLILYGLPELEYIWKGPTQSVSLHRLETVSLGSCPKLRNIFNLAVVTNLPELRRLQVYDCEEWEGIFCEESLQNISSSSSSSSIVCFPRLEAIGISGCHKVRRLFSYSLASHCPSLENISIEDCSQLERLVDEEAAHEDRLPLLKLKELRLGHLPKLKWKEIFGGELECPQHKNENKVVKLELCSLILYGLPELEYIWKGPTQSVSLYRLEIVSLGSCPKLRNIFNLAVVTNLPELRRLQVYDCEEWEGIFCEESLQNISSSSSSSSSSIVCFPRLEAIGISGCHKVRRMFSYALASHCPSLENISIEECSQLERLVDEEAAHEDRLPLLKLKELRLGHLPKWKWKEIFGGELECPQHKNENKVVKSELCSLILYGLPELEYIWKGHTQSVSLHRLETVSLGSCPKLRNIFNLAVVTNLPELKRLQVYDCEEWEGIFCEESLQNISSSSSSIVCFPRLEAIGISGCHKVRRLFSYSLASHCPSLENISIEDCSQLERLVDEEAAHEDRLPLLKLKELRLGLLPKLKWKEIFGGELECPQHKNENKVVKSELCSLILYGLPELEYIWKGPTQSVSLHRLETVSLGSCPKLRNIFNLAVVTNLPELRRLQVYDCEEWEGIFCEESLQNISSSSSSIVCFPRLEAIGISGCHKVRRLFSYSLASHCPSLEEITIEYCSQLEGVIQTYEGEEATHHEKIFPELNYLNLQRLPKLREIYPSYEFTHLSGTMQIEDCPNISNIPLECKTSSDLNIVWES